MRRFLFLLAGCFLVLQLPVTLSYGYDRNADRICITSYAALEVGVQEVGKNNHGPEVSEYLYSAGLPQGHPWCGAFVNWCFSKCQATTPKNAAWAPSWFPPKRIVAKDGVYVRKMPQPGDVIGLFYPNLGRIAHVGIIESWPDSGMIVTIEGNTGPGGGRDGQGVYRKRRLRKQIKLVADWFTV